MINNIKRMHKMYREEELAKMRRAAPRISEGTNRAVPGAPTIQNQRENPIAFIHDGLLCMLRKVL
jgi:hypothetical protein